MKNLAVALPLPVLLFPFPFPTPRRMLLLLLQSRSLSCFKIFLQIKCRKTTGKKMSHIKLNLTDRISNFCMHPNTFHRHEMIRRVNFTIVGAA